MIYNYIREKEMGMIDLPVKTNLIEIAKIIRGTSTKAEKITLFDENKNCLDKIIFESGSTFQQRINFKILRNMRLTKDHQSNH